MKLVCSVNAALCIKVMTGCAVKLQNTTSLKFIEMLHLPPEEQEAVEAVSVVTRSHYYEIRCGD